MQNISYFFSLQNEKYPVAKVSCNKGAEPGGKTETFLLFTLLNFKYLSNVAPQLTAAAFPRPSRRLPPVRRKRDERRDRTAVFQGSVFTEQIESRSAEPGRERFCLKAGRRIPNRSYEEYVAGRGRKKPEAGLPAAADTRPASGRLFRKHFLHVARMQFLVYSVAFDIYRIEVVQLEYDT